MKKVSTQLTKRIEEINELMQQANELDCMAYTYGGGTYPYHVNIKPIEISNQFVYIEAVSQSNHSYIRKERYNVNKLEIWEDNGLSHLKTDLTYIKRALVNAIKNN
jgi:hypothetical protein